MDWKGLKILQGRSSSYSIETLLHHDWGGKKNRKLDSGDAISQARMENTNIGLFGSGIQGDFQGSVLRSDCYLCSLSSRYFPVTPEFSRDYFHTPLFSSCSLVVVALLPFPYQRPLKKYSNQVNLYNVVLFSHEEISTKMEGFEGFNFYM